MDVQMPVMDGLAAVKAIREAERTTGRPRIPVIAVTANALGSQLVDYMLAGMDALVAKPIDFALFATTLNDVISQAAPNTIESAT